MQSVAPTPVTTTCKGKIQAPSAPTLSILHSGKDTSLFPQCIA